MQAEIICTDCSLPYTPCNCDGWDRDHCSNCGTIPRTEVISGASLAPSPKKGNSMLSSLIDSRDEISEAISNLRDKVSEIEDAISELEDAESTIADLIDTLENVDGLSVSVDIDSLSVDISVSL